MGHRALVIYDLLDAYVVAHSHWGAQNLRLEDRITADSLRAGAYPERGLLKGVAEQLTDGDEVDIEEVDHVGGNRGDKDVEEPQGVMEQPCSLGDVLAKHHAPGYEAIYVADVDVNARRGPVTTPDSFEDIERYVRSVDVTGYRTVGLPRIDGASKVADGLEPDIIVYRGDREIGSELARQAWNMQEQHEAGTFGADEAKEIAARQMAETVYERGGRIPDWSPVGGDVDPKPAGVGGAARRMLSSLSGLVA